MSDVLAPPPPMMTPADVAARLNVKLSVAYGLLAPGGQLHHLRQQYGHKTVRVDARALEKVIAEGGVRLCN